MDTIKIFGGNPLIGEVTPIPNKNAILSALPVAILTDKTITYHNVPDTTDVKILLQLLEKLGAEINREDYNNLTINCKSISSTKLDHDLGIRVRASIMFAGPLLARFGRAEIPMPGGCVLGKRSISAHIDVFSKVGIQTEFGDDYVTFTVPPKIQKEYQIWQSEASVTATENLAMYASGTDAKFTLVDAASEPHVTQLLELLNDMGANISGIGANLIKIEGSKSLKNAEYTPQPDFVDIAGLIVATAITDGKVRIKGANIFETVGGFVNWFRKFNIQIQEDGDDLVVSRKGKLKIDLKTSGFPMATSTMPKFSPRPWPGFPVDCLPPVVTLATKTEGQILIQNWMYETGLDFIRELNKMGANIMMCDPQKVIVTGPTKYRKSEIVTPAIIQACKSIFLGALCDPVEIVLHGTEVLKRRYPNVYEVYRSLGADIELL